MQSFKNYLPVPGSERLPLPGARPVSVTHPKEVIEVSVYVRPRAGITNLKNLLAIEKLGAIPPTKRQYMTREELSAFYGADPQDLRKIEEFAQHYKLTVVAVSMAKRSMTLAGTVSAFCAAFGVSLANYEYWGSTYRGRVGPVHIPAALADIVQGVFGLDDRPQVKPHFRIRKELADGEAAEAVHRSSSVDCHVYTPIQLAHLYNFPAGVDGRGQCVALIELGGGYRRRDLITYFAQLGVRVPHITTIAIDGVRNLPTGRLNGPDGEVMLDIEIAGAVAPGARIAAYFAPNTERGFLDALKAAIHDHQNRPSVISISWGGAESSWTAQALQLVDQGFQEAAALGITICCAVGDDGSSDGVSDGYARVDFPASSPYALACGGTRLETTEDGIGAEVVWNDGTMAGATGGGISECFSLPAYQSSANVPPSVNPGGQQGRGVPDVAGNADPATGYLIGVDRQQFVFGGTSAVAPLWAALIALINQKQGLSLGYLNPLLYCAQLVNGGALHDITAGNNGAYQARRGWDPCTGLGTPDGEKLMAALIGPAGGAAR